MKIVDHRPPLKRIDFGLKPRPPEPAEPEGVRALRELGLRIANERIWRLITQSAEGCNCPTSPTQSPDLPDVSSPIAS